MVVLKSVLMGMEVFWQSSPLGQLELVAEHGGSVSSSSNRNQRNVSENHPVYIDCTILTCRGLQ